MALSRARTSRRSALGACALIAVSLATLAAVVAFGRYEPGPAALRAFVTSSGVPPPGAEYPGMVDPVLVWTSPLSEHVAWIAEEYGRWRSWLSLALAAAYLALFTRFYLGFHRDNDVRLTATSLAPYSALAMLFVGIDSARWIALTVITMLVVMAFIARDIAGSGVPVRADAIDTAGGRALVLAGLLGPLGVTWAFPLLARLAQLLT